MERIFGLDTAGNVTEWNTTTAQITGFSEDEATGRHFVNTFMHYEALESVAEVLNSALQGQDVSNYELPIYTKAGVLRRILLSASPVRSPEGFVEGVVGTGVEIKGTVDSAELKWPSEGSLSSA